MSIFMGQKITTDRLKLTDVEFIENNGKELRKSEHFQSHFFVVRLTDFYWPVLFHHGLSEVNIENEKCQFSQSFQYLFAHWLNSNTLLFN